jgi:hypothetical protein
MCKTCKTHNPGKEKKAATKKAATKKTSTTKAKKK